MHDSCIVSDLSYFAAVVYMVFPLRLLSWLSVYAVSLFRYICNIVYNVYFCIVL